MNFKKYGVIVFYISCSISTYVNSHFNVNKYIYMWINAFISRILYYDVKNNKDIKTKILACVTTLLTIDIAVIILASFNMIDIEITPVFIITLLGVNISLYSIYYIILKLWTMWYR